jgi:chromosome segregation protein
MANRLSSLELQGFKTFATTTRLEFPGQVTAIVGPNGSGKSNIADSIRWVLGEQSYSLLRARKTEDMIFSGSQERSRAGMAAATITFNNDDGWLPIDYSEVTISRQAYRDGQNDYLLNGQKVRLKDISELLAQTGLAEMSYTIIGQGLVDVALALKPDERRKLFEEAAGIGLYRSRKEEALRRLENTRKNLERVLDIMTEIRPRLRSLERQSARFIEYQRLRADLQVLLREWYGFHWHQKQEDLKNARTAYLDHEKQLSVIRREHAEVGRKVEESRQELSEKRRALETSHKELSEFHQALEKSSRELAIIDERRRSYNQQKSNLEIDIANVEESLKDLETQQIRFNEEIERRSLDYNAALEELNKVEQHLSEVKSQKETAEAQLSESRKRRVGMETDSVQLTARIDEMNNRLATLTDERSKIQSALADLNQQLASLQLKAKVTENQFADTQKRVTSKELELKAKQVELDQMQQEKQDETDRLASLEAELAKLQAQYEVLQQAEAALSGYSEGSKSVLKDSRAGKLPKGIEALSKHLVVEERFEQALSAALGELADLLIVPANSTEIIVSYLEKNEKDRVALLIETPSETLAVSSAMLKQKGAIGLANDLVKIEGPYNEIVSPILSQIIIVEDWKTAQSIQPKLRGFQKVVTLNGLVFQSNGVVTTGQNASAKRIGRTRRKGELTDDLEKTGKTLAAQQEKLTKISSNIENRLTELEDIKKDLDKSKIAQETARHDRQATVDALTRLEEQLAWYSEQLEDLAENESQTQTHIEEHQDQLEKLQKQINELLDIEQVHQENVNAVPVFEIRQELNHCQTHQIVTKNVLDTARQRAHDHQNRIKDVRERLELHLSRLEMIQNGLAEIAKQELLLKDSIGRISNKIAKIEETRINPLTQSQDEVEKSVIKLQKLEDQSHQQMIIAERQYTQLQLELDRRNDQLQNLTQRIEDDFGLVSYDYEIRMDGPKPLPFEDGTIENLPLVKEIPDTLEGDIKHLKSQIRRIGSINPEAQQEYIEVKERYEFLSSQIEDLEKASEDLQKIIEELDVLMERDFLKTFKAVNQEFSVYFTRLFNGGEAKLMFSDEENPVEGGVDIEARLPGRRQQGLALLSGGERSLTAVALIFSLLKVSPTPLCILDEVDAMLDESNVGRFIGLLRELAAKTQFVIITHNRNTVQAADVIYGVTMGRESTSQMISLKLEDVDETYLE